MQSLLQGSVMTVLLGLSLSAPANDTVAFNPSQVFLQGGVAHLNDAFNENTGVKVEMPGNPKGCGATVLGLKTGKLDAGLMCCPPNMDEMGQLGLVASAVARDGIVFSVHDTNPVTNLTTEQIRGIYQGRITNWKDVGGRDAPIQPYAFVMCPQRQEAMRQYVVGVSDHKRGVVGIDNSKLADNVRRVNPGPKVNQSVAADPNGIGISSAAYLPVKGVRFVSIDGVKPTLESISNASYPATRYLYVVTKGYPSGATKQYIDFMRSPEGQMLLGKEGRLGQI
jgi:phosphate transport system substrate-binding protein